MQTYQLMLLQKKNTNGRFFILHLPFVRGFSERIFRLNSKNSSVEFCFEPKIKNDEKIKSDSRKIIIIEYNLNLSFVVYLKPQTTEHGEGASLILQFGFKLKRL